MSKKDSISKDDVCYLIAIIIEIDNLKRQKKIEREPRPIFCAPLSIGQREFSVSFAKGLKPEIVLVVDHDEYDGETIITYQEQRYEIYRTFVREDGDIELYCGTKVGDS